MTGFDPNKSPVEGLYEQLITSKLQSELARIDGTEWGIQSETLDEVMASHVLADHLFQRVRSLLTEVPKERQVEVANRLLAAIDDQDAPEDPVEVVRVGHDDNGRPARLLALHPGDDPGVYKIRPSTPITESALLTNLPEEPGIGHEIRQELVTADRVDLLCAFVKWSGMRTLRDALKVAHERGIPIRVLTTTYMGATEQRALDALVRDYGAQVKVSYEVKSTRLHAKAWLFRRNTGYDTAYVGSSNLSRPALVDGLEWNVRLSSHSTPHIIEKFEVTFESYWGSGTFEPYDPDRDAERFQQAIAEAGGASERGGTVTLSNLEVRPLPFQKDMLERLNAARHEKGIHRNLLVSATGTGKTVMAALDYRQLCESSRRRPNLLFIAHREEILDQSLRCYREVLGDANFGDKLNGKERPYNSDYVFASVQTLSKDRHLDQYTPDAYDVIVIDEFHHSAAKTYRKVIDHFRPKELLGLTATPERGDGVRIQDLYFNGEITAELRLWEALENELLSPFHYFGISDNTDLRAVSWRRGGYDHTELKNLLSADHARARTVIRAVRDTVTDPHLMKALGFCVSVAHAEFMKERFNDVGIRAEYLHGDVDDARRVQVLQDLKAGMVNIVFSVDLLNEGVDIPDVDTLLLLRPTESATVFLQQLGRGLRRTPSKDVLTVLDFIGLHRKEFRFEETLGVLANAKRRTLESAVEQDFPKLPSGCQVILERKAKERVLSNIRTQLQVNVNVLANEVRDYGTTDLVKYLHESNRTADEVYRKGSWTSLLRRASLLPTRGPDGEDKILTRVRGLRYVDDAQRYHYYKMMLGNDAPRYQDLDAQGKAYARMLFFSIWDGKWAGFKDYQEGFEALRRYPDVVNEMRQVLDYGIGCAEHTAIPLVNGLSALPLQVHAKYSRSEYLAALGWANLSSGDYPLTFNEGVLWREEIKTDAFFVTLRKDSRGFSPKTMYKDAALNEHEIRWQTQHKMSSESPSVQRYRDHVREGSQILLFIRSHTTDDAGGAVPMTFLGPATYVADEGSNPVSFTWRLKYPMPVDVLNYAEVAHVG
ncbi:DUF3427 domain-containing protein [Nocardiopsis baichengensis]|uniref:DUF3427 domain-containing protein n=1 Tax=Nocardiopsis baichengensis TaxID=280240 RepID=UPI00034CEF53|nr:DEAD/DEAH box helicase [Nocardiopsis baichengensis]